MSLVDHLWNWRRRLIISFVGFFSGGGRCLSLSEELFIFLVNPLAHIVSFHNHCLVYTWLTEAFLTYLKVSLLGAFIISSSVFLSQIWFFILTELYRPERNIFIIFLWHPLFCFLQNFLSPIVWSVLKLGNFSSALKNRLFREVFPFIWKPGWANTSPLWQSPSCPLDSLSSANFSFGVITCRNSKTCKTQGQCNYAFLGIVVVAALLTPSDFVNPFSLIDPIYGLYEISINLMC